MEDRQRHGPAIFFFILLVLFLWLYFIQHSYILRLHCAVLSTLKYSSFIGFLRTSRMNPILRLLYRLAAAAAAHTRASVTLPTLLYNLSHSFPNPKPCIRKNLGTAEQMLFL